MASSASIRIPNLFRFVGVSAAVVSVGMLAWAGGDPWKTKPYQQWDAKDVQKIITDSPWAKLLHVQAPWLGGAAEVDSAESGVRVGQPGVSVNAPEARQGGTSNPQALQAVFVVRWISSRTLREAAFRNEILSGRMKEEDAEKQLAQIPETFQVYVAGPDMAPFRKTDEAVLRNTAYVVGKKSKRKIMASAAQIQRGADGKIQSVIFVFPKKAESGEGSIASDEKSVDFYCTIEGWVKIDANFDLSKMEDKQGRDL
jgi:hypothetical protein